MKRSLVRVVALVVLVGVTAPAVTGGVTAQEQRTVTLTVTDRAEPDPVFEVAEATQPAASDEIVFDGSEVAEAAATPRAQAGFRGVEHGVWAVRCWFLDAG